MRVLITSLALISAAACSYHESVGSNIAQRSDANLSDSWVIDEVAYNMVWNGFLATGIAVHDDDVYWVDTEALPNVMHGVARLAEPAGVLPPEPRFGPGIAADADHVYIAAQLATAEWGVLAFDVHTAVTTTLLSGVAEPIGEIGVAHGGLYYLTSPAAAPADTVGALRVVPLGGGAPAVVIDHLSAPTQIRFDDNYVYVTDEYQGRLLASGTQGTLVIADSLDHPHDVTSDGDYLYIVERGLQSSTGRISRVMRPASGATQASIDSTAVAMVSGLDLPMGAVVEGGMLRWTSFNAGLQTAPVLGGQVQDLYNPAGPGYGPIVVRRDHRMLFGMTNGNHSYVGDWIPHD